MKINLSVLLLLLLCRVSTAQNLVPNGDFEIYSSCPSTYGQINCSVPWINPTSATPDYFNQCATGANVHVPANYPGYQLAYNGGAYAGILLFTQPPYVTDQREYIEVPLTSPLLAGVCYQFQMYASRSNNCRYATDDVGVYFSNAALPTTTTIYPLPYTPQISNTTGNITDSLNWVLISGNYTATGGESYLTIGNFKNDSNTTYLLIDPSATYAFAYCYIDAVCLSPCSSSCLTGIDEQYNLAAITLYPNPSHGNITITSPSPITHVKITNTLGQLLQQLTPNTKTAELRITDKGIYFISITTGSEVVIRKAMVE